MPGPARLHRVEPGRGLRLADVDLRWPEADPGVAGLVADDAAPPSRSDRTAYPGPAPSVGTQSVATARSA
jgi:hypothetical protein